MAKELIDGYKRHLMARLKESRKGDHTPPKENDDIHDICLWIDNSAPVLARVMRAIDIAKPTDWVKRVSEYLKYSAAADMKLYGDRADRENAEPLRLALIRTNDDGYRELASHYTTKYKEGERLVEYLK